MARKKIRSANSSLGIKRFNKVLSETRKVLKKSGKDIPFDTARKYVSEFVYPHFNKIPTFKLTKKSINLQAKKVIRTIPPEDTSIISKKDNIDYLNWGDITGVEFYELEEIIKTVIPKDMIIQINAGKLGIIPFFKAKNWKLVRPEWIDLREEIREFAVTPEKASGASGSFLFYAQPFHLKGKPVNKNIKNNGIEFRLISDKYGDVYKEFKNIENEKVDIEAKGTREKGTKKRKLSEKLKELKKKKKKEHEEVNKIKKKGKNKSEVKDMLELRKTQLKIQRSIEKERRTLLESFKLGLISKKEYRKENEAIAKRYLDGNNK